MWYQAIISSTCTINTRSHNWHRGLPSRLQGFIFKYNVASSSCLIYFWWSRNKTTFEPLKNLKSSCTEQSHASWNLSISIKWKQRKTIRKRVDLGTRLKHVFFCYHSWKKYNIWHWNFHRSSLNSHIGNAWSSVATQS